MGKIMSLCSALCSRHWSQMVSSPLRRRCTMSLSFPRMKNTHAAPSDVPAKGINIPLMTSQFIFKPPSVPQGQYNTATKLDISNHC